MLRLMTAAIVFLCLIASPANAFSCDEVRAFVAEHGKVRALALAIQSGATWQQIKEARKCLPRK